MNKPYTYTYEQEYQDALKRQAIKNNLILIGITGAIFALMVLMAGCACAKEVIIQPNIDGYSVNQWCEAIRHAEGVNSKHPYGILTKYKHTTPLQACRNTVAHKWRDYSALPSKTRQSKRFLEYLQERYAPINAKNDPNGLNRNWVKNVNYWLKKGA